MAGRPRIREETDPKSVAMTQAAQQADMEAQEQNYYRIAARLEFARLDGYLTTDEFHDILYSMGILTDYQKGQR